MTRPAKLRMQSETGGRGGELKTLLHVADPTIGTGGLHLLAALWHAAEADQHLLIIGHHDGLDAARRTGIPADRIHWHRALGRYDPAAYFGIARAVKMVAPHAVGLWGNWAQHMGCIAARNVAQCIDFIPPSQPYIVPAFYAQWLVTGRRAAVGFDRGEALVCGSTPLRYCPQGWYGIQPAARPYLAAPDDSTAGHDCTSAESPPPTCSDIPDASYADESGSEHLPAEHRRKILIVAGTDPSLRVDIALWAAAIASQIEPAVELVMAVPAGRWGVNAERLKRIAEFIADLPSDVNISVDAELLCGCERNMKADVCVLAADGPVVLAPILAAAAAGTPVVTTATAQIQSAQPLPGLAATAPPNNPRLLAAAIVDTLRKDCNRRDEVMQIAKRDQETRHGQLAALVTTLLAESNIGARSG
jgi:glycosyltransferase involved in cell wall biosynthesis